MPSIESRCVVGPENILFASASVHLSAQEILLAESVKGLNRVILSVCVAFCTA